MSSSCWAQVANYSFDYSTRDLSDNGNTALRETSAFPFPCGEFSLDAQCPQWNTDRHGASQYALEFNITPQQIDAEQYLSLPDLGLSGDFTVAAWVRFVVPARSYERIIDFGQGQQQHNIVFARVDTSNDLIFIIYEGATPIGNCVASDVIVGGEWAHFAGTWRSGDQRIYKNGVEVAACNAVGEPQDVPRPNNYVGRSNWASDAYFRGYIDHLWIDDRAVSAAEVQALAEEGMLRSQGVAAFYSFDGNRLDGSGNQRTAQLVGPSVSSFGHDGRSFPHGAIRFIGSNHLITPDLPIMDGTVSVAAWVWMDEVRTWGRVVDLADGNGNNNIIVSRVGNNDDLMIEVYNGAASLGKCIAADVIPELPQWFHYTATWAGGRQRIYVNGELEQTCDFSGGPASVVRENSYIADLTFPGTRLSSDASTSCGLSTANFRPTRSPR